MARVKLAFPIMGKFLERWDPTPLDQVTKSRIARSFRELAEHLNCESYFCRRHDFLAVTKGLYRMAPQMDAILLHECSTIRKPGGWVRLWRLLETIEIMSDVALTIMGKNNLGPTELVSRSKNDQDSKDAPGAQFHRHKASTFSALERLPQFIGENCSGLSPEVTKSHRLSYLAQYCALEQIVRFERFARRTNLNERVLRLRELMGESSLSILDALALDLKDLGYSVETKRLRNIVSGLRGHPRPRRAHRSSLIRDVVEEFRLNLALQTFPRGG